MVEKTVDAARRNLRAARIQDTLGLNPSAIQESRYRDRLIPVLQRKVATQLLESSEEADKTIDAAVSTALAVLDETAADRLIALALASHVFAVHSEFARLRELAGHYSDLGRQFEASRPFLSAICRSFALLLRGSRNRAGLSLNKALGLSSPGSGSSLLAERTWESIGDVLLANGLRSWIETDSIDELAAVGEIALDKGDGLLLLLADTFAKYAEAANRSNSFTVVSAKLPQFRTGVLLRYLKSRGNDTLFASQVSAIEGGVLDRGSHLVAMPTSSGKTFLAELRIAVQLGRFPETRVVYLAPYRLLARQVEENLRNGLKQAGYSVRDLGSAFDLDLEDQLGTDELPSVAIMTPERMDALMRLASTGRRGSEVAAELLSSTSLVIFDEIQLIGRQSRGPRLELFLTRLRQRYPQITILGLAAASQGVEELADWLQAPPPVDGGRRPTGTIEVIWKTDGTLYQRFDDGVTKVGELPRSGAAIDDAASLVASIRDEHLPVLIVEPIRQYAENVIRKIRRISPRAAERWRSTLNPVQREALETVAEVAFATMGENSDLPDLIRDGLAFHHAGIPPHLLRMIEDLVSEHRFRAIGATTTVAEGAHLPFQVAIVPHVYFQPIGGPIPKDLYQNIVGRAGRAKVAMEGLVLIIDSDSRSVRGHVESQLWNETVRVEVRGQLTEALLNVEFLDSYQQNREVQSQVLAWLGDPGAYVVDQAQHFSSKTFSWHVANDNARDVLVRALDDTFVALEHAGLAHSASPYALTTLGERYRLAGLSPTSCIRLDKALAGYRELLLNSDLFRTSKLTDEAALVISELVFETEEVLEKSLWFRRLGLENREQAAILRRLGRGELDWPTDSDVFKVDVHLLKAWIMGASYEDLGSLPPVFGDRKLFGRANASIRISDAADYIGRLSYPAAWTWGAAVAMLGDEGDQLPAWIRQSIELGSPSTTSIELVRSLGLSRTGALRLADQLSSEWDLAESQLYDMTQSDLFSLGVSISDIRRLPTISS
ncbi:hypothetical protein BH23CHL1_BH23CHL1_16420 [soil metagenome]